MDDLGFSRTFTDALKREWTVTIDMTNDDRLEAITGVSLVNLIPVSKKKGSKEPGDFTTLGEFMSDPYAIFNAFYALVKPDADRLGLDRQGVKAGIDGKTAELMGRAILRAIHDFFPHDPARQAAIRRIVATITEMSSKAATRATKELSKINLDELIDAMPTLDASTATSDLIARLRNSASTTAVTSASSQDQ